SVPGGRARAFMFDAVRSGTARRGRIYLTRAARAHVAALALYTDAKGRPGRRVASGQVRHPKRGRWVSIRLSPGKVVAHHRYWIVVLGTGGRLAYRGTRRRCAVRNSVQRQLSSLPRRWRNGGGSGLCGIAAYVIQTTVHHLSTPAPSPPRPPPPVIPPPPPTPAAGSTSYVPAPCTQTLTPGANIQSALRAAAPGTVICLAPGN